jgi:hypothetical protein
VTNSPGIEAQGLIKKGLLLSKQALFLSS